MALFDPITGRRIRISSKITIIKKLREILLAILGVLFKFDTVDAINFTGTPKTYDVVFDSPYSGADYAVNIGVITTSPYYSYMVTVINQTAAGFTLSLGTDNKDCLVSVSWQTLRFEL